MSKIHDDVTTRILADLEQGVAPWVKPWDAGMGGQIMPFNAATNRYYRGVNVLTLWASAIANGYRLPRWLTYRQARELGGYVKEGQRSTHVVLVSRMKVKGKDEAGDPAGDEREIAFLRYYFVFNVAQCEGLPDHLYASVPERPEPERHDIAEAFLKAIPAKVELGAHQACYLPSVDTVMMPNFKAFQGPEHFYATFLHEDAHWSGHKSRLNRDLSGRFGSQAYAFEELVAELTAAFLCAELGIQGYLRHSEYIGNWCGLLRDHQKAIFSAAAMASAAADFLASFSTPAQG